MADDKTTTEGLDRVRKLQDARGRPGWHNGARVTKRPFADLDTVDYLARFYSRTR